MCTHDHGGGNGKGEGGSGSGLSRRDLLRASAAAGGALAFSSWFGSLARAAGLDAGAKRAATADAVVLVWLAGGPSHVDTFDPKPLPAVSGATRAIDTALSGVRFADKLPLLAARAKRLGLIRSMRHTSGEHDRGTYYAHTGYVPVAATAHPSVGAVLAHERPGADPAIPSYVTIGGTPRGAGFLGSAVEPFALADPLAPPSFLRPPLRVDAARGAERLALLDLLDGGAAAARPGTPVAEHVVFTRRAAATSGGSFPTALDLAAEPDTLRDRYGRDSFGASCLMARRLVQSGVRAVEISLPGWDTHEDNFARTGLLAAVLDRGLAALLDDLDARKLLTRTLVVCLGEFGRTPEINARGGREHHPGAYSALLFGGGVRPGTVVGRTDDRGNAVVERPVTVPDLLATIYVAAGVDPDRTFYTPGGRPIDVAPDGTPIAELVG
jgi:uncharacterized protein (DUF1501 family)